jgi:hypothetical protein
MRKISGACDRERARSRVKEGRSGPLVGASSGSADAHLTGCDENLLFYKDPTSKESEEPKDEASRNHDSIRKARNPALVAELSLTEFYRS